MQHTWIRRRNTHFRHFRVNSYVELHQTSDVWRFNSNPLQIWIKNTGNQDLRNIGSDETKGARPGTEK